MENDNLQALQQELRDTAKLTYQLAEHVLNLSKIIDSYAGIHTAPNEKNWIFPENDYDWLGTWLTTNEYALAKKCQWLHESWPAYANRLSKFIGWNVDPEILRRCLKLKTGVPKVDL